MSIRLAGVCAGLLLVPAGWAQAQVRPQGNAPYDVVIKKNVMVPVRDGTRLALDLYLPAQNGQPVAGKHTTLLARTPYDKNLSPDARWFCAHGYAVVVNDVRGRYASEGTWRMLLDDPNDGYDILQWIGSQPWSSGKVGTFGTSYVGGTQHALACARPSQLACMIPVDSMSNTGIAGVRHSGAFELRFMNWIFTIGAPNARAALADPGLKQALESGTERQTDAAALAAPADPDGNHSPQACARV
jgi:putative CocE/NonD family hydrolase